MDGFKINKWMDRYMDIYRKTEIQIDRTDK